MISDRLKNWFSKDGGLGYLQIYNLTKAAAVVVIAIIFARLISDPILINHWETSLLLVTGFTFFYVSGFGYTLVSFVKRYPEEEWALIFKNTFFVFCLLSLLSCSAIIGYQAFSRQVFFSNFEWLFLCIYLIGTVCSSVVEYVYFLNKKFKKLGNWAFFNLLGFVLFPSIPLLMGYSFSMCLASLALFGAIRFGFTLNLIWKMPGKFKPSYIKPLAEFNWPITLSLIFGTGYVYIANFLLKSSVDDQAFNIFRYGSREFPLFTVLANSYSIILGGNTAENFDKPDFWKKTQVSHRRLMHQVFPMACLLMLSSPFVFNFVFTNSFKEASTIFNILLLTIIPRLLFPQSLLMGKAKTKYALYSGLIEFVSGIALVWLLTPIYGIAGAAWGITLAFFIEKMLLILFCYYQKIPFMRSLETGFFVIYSLLLVICFCLSSELF